MMGLQKGILLSLLIILLTSGCSTTTMITKKDRVSSKPDPVFKIALWMNREDRTYQIGEEVYVFFAANRDCYLTLIDICSDGKVRILLPNRYQKENHAKAGYVYRVPSQNARFTFKAMEFGEETIIAIATLEDIQLYDQVDIKGDGSFKEFGNEADILEHIDKRLRSYDPEKWAKCQMTIKIGKQNP